MDLSIFVMYSPDRKPQFDQMVRLNSRMDGWDDAQKIVLIDGTDDPGHADWLAVEVPRPARHYNWSRAWDCGVRASVHDNILYLDSDRVLPRDYLSQAVGLLNDRRFVFSDSLFALGRPVEDELVAELVDYSPERLRTEIDDLNRMHSDLISYDPRYRLPLHGPGKGPMSGNVAFTKEGYRKSGGVDPWFEGHGAYADTDFHKQVWEAGFEIVPLEATEIHLWHPKLGESRSELTMRDIEILSLNNFIYHAKKWRLGYHYPKAIAAYLGLGDGFVDRVLEEIELGGGNFEPLMS